MRTYPISVPRSSYRGSNARKLANAADYSRVAARVEDYINSKLRSAPDDTVHVFHSYEIALDLAEGSSIVHDVVHSIDCGSHGVTIVKGDLDRALGHPQVNDNTDA
jgi:hypothetical protein